MIVREGKIIGEGVNSVTLTNDPTAHAEVMAIRQACKAIKSYNLEDAIIYTSCEPCPMCLSAIYWARIKSIYFGNSKIDAAQIKFDDQFIYQEIAKSHSERKIPCQQIMQKEAQVAFKIWEQKSDKILY